MFKILLKFTLSFALCYWLVKTGKLDFTLVSKLINSGSLWIFGLLLILSGLFINSLRLKILLDTKSKNPLPYLKILAFSAIGNFFSVILPGASMGDVIKFFYLKKLNRDASKATIASLMILDRLIGLLGLFLLATLMCVGQLEVIRKLHPVLLTLTFINISATLGSGFFIFLLFSKFHLKNKFLVFFSKWPKIEHALSDLFKINLSIIPFIKCLSLSLLNQSVTIGSFWLLASAYLPAHVSFSMIFTITPIGMVGSSLPISPGGLGVGHALFDNLFKLLGIQNGASLFNLYFVGYFLISLLGAIPYLFYRQKDPM